jgi:hypothetical protein
MDSIRLSDRSRRDFFGNILTRNFLTKLATFLFALLLPLVHSGAQRSLPPGYLNDNSDWWSSVGGSQTMNITVQHRMPSPLNIQILGINLEGSRLRDFQDAIAKLGQAKVTSRGDGAESRQQICYVSSGSAGKVHLIFEGSEIFASFYLFSGGPEWTGSDRCVKSDLISGSLGTDSGVHLGQSRMEVEKMLGEPSASSEKRSLYSFEGERTKEGLVYTIDISVDARFENSKLIYLAISRSEVN